MFYQAEISEEAIDGLSEFARAGGLTSGAVAYEEVVAAEFRELWAT